MSAVSCALALVEIEFAAALLQNNPHVSYLEWQATGQQQSQISMTENWRNPSPILKIPQQMVDTAPCLNVSALKQCRAYRALTSTCSVNRFDEVVPLSGRVDAESHIYTRRVARKKPAPQPALEPADGDIFLTNLSVRNTTKLFVYSA